MFPIIQAKKLSKHYNGKAVVDQITFHVNPGECFGILGPNGAGKTTLMRMITGLTPVDEGVLQVFELPMSSEQKTLFSRIGVVAQENNLDTDLSVTENIWIYGHYFGLSHAQIIKRQETLLEFAQLTEQKDRPVRSLSGGMMRRLVIARALVASPELVILDEPTTSLDPQARHLIWKRLNQLKASGVTLLLTTHYMEEAAQLCDRLMVMNHGHILDSGSPQELIKRHVEAEVVEIRPLTSKKSDKSLFDNLPGRLESVGETLYFYTKDAAPILAKLHHHQTISCLMRPANLEDVFLRLTGRDLRD